MSFSENLKKIRIEKSISQQALAEMIGVSQTAVYHWEKGIRTPKMGALVRMASVLNVPIMDFFLEDENGKPIINTTDTAYEEIFKNTSYAVPNYTKLLKNIKSDKINELFDSLNDSGQDKAIEQVELLTKIPEYKADIISSEEVLMKLDEDGNLTEYQKEPEE